MGGAPGRHDLGGQPHHAGAGSGERFDDLGAMVGDVVRAGAVDRVHAADVLGDLVQGLENRATDDKRKVK